MTLSCCLTPPWVTKGAILQAAAETHRLCFLWFAGQLCRGRFPELTRCMEFKGRLAQRQGTVVGEEERRGGEGKGSRAEGIKEGGRREEKLGNSSAWFSWKTSGAVDSGSTGRDQSTEGPYASCKTADLASLCSPRHFVYDKVKDETNFRSPFQL